MSNGGGSTPGKILAVIVLYKMAPRESESFISLQRALQSGGDASRWKVMFFDNTPGGQAHLVVPESAMYESDGRNRGLAAAYNRAIEVAGENDCEWLLTLDQDTSLGADFTEKIEAAVTYTASIPVVAAVVPRITDGGRIISPNALSLKMFPKFFPPEFVGVALDSTTSAVNSASVLRVSALEAMGGYDLRFWLDYSDAVMYRRLQKCGYRIFVAGNIDVEHELSVLKMKERVSVERYEDILGAESAFWDEYMGRVALPALMLRFAYRMLYKFGRTGGTFPFFLVTIRFALRRIFYSRSRRLQLWQESVQKKLATLDRPTLAESVRTDGTG
jgi:GT2 family glycosyltransferase